MQLVPNPPGKIVKGEIKFKGKNLTYATEKQMQENTWQRNLYDFSRTDDIIRSSVHNW